VKREQMYDVIVVGAGHAGCEAAPELRASGRCVVRVSGLVWGRCPWLGRIRRQSVVGGRL